MSKGQQHLAHSQRKAQTREVSIEQSQSFSGPLPHPELMRQYNEIQPGFAERIFQMTEAESKHRRSIEETVVKRAFNQGMWGMIFGFAAVLAVLALCYVCIMEDHAGAAGTIASTVLVALATVFVVGRRTNKPVRKEEPTEE